jgi:ferric iron reductase protein FhuF
MVAVVINFFDFGDESYTYDNDSGNPYFPYAVIFAVSSVLDLLSNTIKEHIVRSQPVDEQKFTFYVSLSQFICGLLISPIILALNKKYVDFGKNPNLSPEDLAFSEFFK